MSAFDKLRSFAEAREPDSAIIRDGLTYGDARELIATDLATDHPTSTLTISEPDAGYYHILDDGRSIAKTKSRRAAERIVAALARSSV